MMLGDWGNPTAASITFCHQYSCHTLPSTAIIRSAVTCLPRLHVRKLSMRIRYLVLLMLVLLSVVTYMDRICIGVAAGAMQKDLGISESAWGWVLGAFLLSYGLFEIPTGALGDWIGQRRVLTRIVVWWSAFTALTPLAANYYLLVATRFLFGAGEAGAYPNASGCISRWFPLGERARAQGLVWGASRLGGALTPLVVVPLMKALGWRACFWLFAALGVVWAVVWTVWYRDDPADHSAVTPRELDEIRAGQKPSHETSNVSTPPGSSPYSDPTNTVRSDRPADLNPYAAPRVSDLPNRPVAGTEADSVAHIGVPWAALAASPQLWLIVAMYWFYVFGFIFFMFWLPKYLTKGRGLSDEQMAVCVALCFTLGALANAVGGWASDRLSQAFGLPLGRKLIGVTCLALSGVLLF